MGTESILKDTGSWSNHHNLETRGHSPQFQRRHSFWGTQAVVSSGQTVLSYPLGYPDAFSPDKTMLCHKTPSPRLQLEASLTDLVGLQGLELHDITLGSTFRKDGFFTISDAERKAVILLAHRISTPHFFLPFYKGNPAISQNGFKVKVKDLHGLIVLTFIRPTVYPSQNQTDGLEIWLGDKGHLVGRVDMPHAVMDEFKVYDELGDLVYVLKSGESPKVPSDGEKPYRSYLIYSSKKVELVGKISLKIRQGFGSPGGSSSTTSPLRDHPFGVEFKTEIGIVHKTLLLGALFLITGRRPTAVDKMGQKELILLEPLEDDIGS